MSLLHTIITSVKRSKKRLGRGYGSGKGGHTSGRGQKGQNTRGKSPLWFEGGQLPLIRRTPFIKGKSRFKSLSGKPMAIRIEALNAYEAGSLVDYQTIVDTLKLQPTKVARQGVKIVFGGKLTKALTVNLPLTATAAQAVIASGGKVEEMK
jgi:large subunit ribosomal protein L15